MTTTRADQWTAAARDLRASADALDAAALADRAGATMTAEACFDLAAQAMDAAGAAFNPAPTDDGSCDCHQGGICRLCGRVAKGFDCELPEGHDGAHLMRIK